ILAEVARQLGNTPAVCKKSYVHPAVLELGSRWPRPRWPTAARATGPTWPRPSRTRSPAWSRRSCNPRARTWAIPRRTWRSCATPWWP
ncbi:hypothetical protein ACQKEU_15080, partial [Acidovorax sp. NPDC077664]